MEEFIADWVCGMLLDFQDSIKNVTQILGQNLQSNTNMWNMVGTVQGVVKPICYTIMVIFFLTEFIKMSMKMDMLKWEYIFKVMAKFVIAKAFIDFGPTLLDAIYSTVAEWITKVGYQNDLSVFNDVRMGIENKMKAMDFWGMLGFAVTCIVPMLVLMACSFIVEVIAYGRLIEIYVLLACMPIPFAFVLDGEGHSNITKKYILNFAGVCLQGLLIVISCTLYKHMMGDIIARVNVSSADIYDLIYTMVIGAMVMVVAVAKCGQWGKQLLSAM